MLLLLVSACGSDSGSPGSPSTPTIMQVGGVWVGNVTQSSVSGGECVGALFQSSNGSSDRYTITINQSGSSLTGSATSQSTGQTCSYSGTAGSSTMTFNVTSCPSTGFRVTCNGGVQRDIYLNSRNFTATLGGNILSGTVGENWNVYVAGGTVNPIAGMSLTYNVGLSH